MNLGSNTFAQIVANHGGVVDCQISDDCDYGEKLQAVVGQFYMLTLGLHTSSNEQVWQLDVASLAQPWYAGCGNDIPHAEHIATAGFMSFEAAMSAFTDLVSAHAAAESGFFDV